jgi:hypothetical protein
MCKSVIHATPLDSRSSLDLNDISSQSLQALSTSSRKDMILKVADKKLSLARSFAGRLVLLPILFLALNAAVLDLSTSITHT